MASPRESVHALAARPTITSGCTHLPTLPSCHLPVDSAAFERRHRRKSGCTLKFVESGWPTVVSIDAALDSVTFLADRTPATDQDDYFAELSHYRDGAMFVASYAGTTEWECHGTGDEIVLVINGETTLIPAYRRCRDLAQAWPS